jgi:hypothetical protein
VIPFRIGQTILAATLAFVLPQFFPFPYQTPVASANPVIPIRTRSLSELQVPPPIVPPQYYRLVPSADVYPAIPIRNRPLSELAIPPPVVPSQYGKVVTPSVAPANTVIPVRMRQLDELRDEAASRYPLYQSYTFFERAASPILPIQTRTLSELTVAPPLVLPQYGKLVPFVAAPTANSIIPLRSRALSELTVVPPLVSPQSSKLVPFARTASIPFRTIPFVTTPPLDPIQSRVLRVMPFQQATSGAFIPFRQTRLEFPAPTVIQLGVFHDATVVPEPAHPVILFRLAAPVIGRDPHLIDPQYGRVMPFASAAAPSNPGVLFRVVARVKDSEPIIVAPRYGKLVPFIGAAATASPVLLIRTTALVPSLSLDPIRSSVIRVSAFPQATASAIVPYRQTRLEFPASTSIQLGVFRDATIVPESAHPAILFRVAMHVNESEPALVVPRYGELVPFVTASTANPIIPTRTRPLNELTGMTSLVPPQSSKLIPFARSATISFRLSQHITTLAVLVPPQYGKVITFQSAAPTSTPIIPIQMRQLLELRTRDLTRASIFAPYTSVIAPSNAVIPVRLRQLSELRERDLVRSSSFAPYTIVFPANTVIPFRARDLSELQTPGRLIAPQYGRVVVPSVAAPANAIILFRYGQWVGDAVVPLVGIHGYFQFPWVSAAVAAPPDHLLACMGVGR